MTDKKPEAKKNSSNQSAGSFAPKNTPPKPTVFAQLSSLRSDIEAEMDKQTDIVRIALGNVIGAIDHVRDARHQADPLWRRH